jgi:methyl-accepting chemotaxis protein
MKNAKIGARLAAGFGAVLILLAVMTAIAVTRMQTASDMTDKLVNVSVKNQGLVAEWEKIIEANGVRTVAAWKSTDAADQHYFEEQMAKSSGRTGELQKLVGDGLRSPVTIAKYKDLLAARVAYNEVRTAVFKAKAAGDLELGKKLFETEMLPKGAAYLDAVQAMAAAQRENQNKVAQSIAEQYKDGRTLLISVGLLAIAIGVAFSIWVTRSITGPIRKAVKVAETVSSGDLSSNIVVESRDETGMLMQALKNMNDNLVQIVGQVRSGTDTIATASAEIAAGNQDLSSRTEQQAGSLEETASSMEELTSTVKQNADNARQANKLAVNAADIASRGGAVVAEVVSTMGSINESSRKIVDIISVIDGIAFQTNILALNAAVEAARAGEQGRGFAVVATEVRNLAQRSAAAAKEIKGLIDDSVQKVEAGTTLVDKAGSTMTEIVASIGHVTDIMNEISSASDEQSAGIEQVHHAITDMDQVTQQNAALVEQASAAAQAMQDQAGQLAAAVGVFKLAAGTAAPQTAAAPRPQVKTKPQTAARPVQVSRAPAPALAKAEPRLSKKTAAAGGSDDWEEF